VHVLVVDAANVMGSRPDGWWRDRAAAAGRLKDRLAAADLAAEEVVLVLEGRARPGVPEGRDGRVRTVHASGSGDDAIVAVATEALRHDGRRVTVVTADRELRLRVQDVGAEPVGPSWLLDRL
jgi:hypothetical protein